MSYREQFGRRDAAVAYDEVQYRPGSYANLLWQIEQEQLRNILADLRSTHRRIHYLDFAAGTGRVLEFVAPLVESATAIEVSEAMAERARSRYPAASVLCRDITAADAPIEAQYDFVTAFRFVLNAEHDLRIAGLEALGRRLRDDSSVLVFNNHGNLWSHKALLWPVHRAGGSVQHGRSGNYLSHRQVVRLVGQVGLQIDSVVGSGVVGDRVARRLPSARVLDWERRAAASLVSRFGVNQLYVCRRIAGDPRFARER